jgi:cytochrome c1
MIDQRDDYRLEALRLTGGDPDIGADLIQRHGCSGCHRIPGIAGADGRTGPPLDGFAGRAYVGGVLPNRPQNVVAWVLDPQAVDPLTAMPATGLTEGEAKHVAAYLYTLR